MKKLIMLVALTTLLTGCATGSPERLNALLDRLEFEEGEAGCVRLETNAGLMAGVIGGADTKIIYKKSKPLVEGQPAPDC